MSLLNEIVNVNIVLSDAAITRASFGIPMLAAVHDFWPERVRTFTSRDEAIAAGVVSGSIVDQILLALLGQENNVEQFKIGKRANVHDQTLRLLPDNTEEGFIYTFTVTGPGALNPTTITHTVGAAESVSDITAALTPQIDAISGVTATDNGTNVTFGVNTPGELMDVAGWIQVDDTSALELRDVTFDPGLLADLDAIAAVDGDWYGLLLDSNSKAEAEVAATFILTRVGLFAYQNSDGDIKNPLATTDVFSVIQATTNNRTIQHYTEVNLLNFLAAARFGDRLPTDPGSSTWNLRGAQGVPVENASFSNADRIAVKAKNGEVFVFLKGQNVFNQGISAGGRFIDLTRGIDELEALLQENVLSALVNNEKIPFTVSGIGLIQGTVLSTLNSRVGELKLLAPEPSPAVRAPLPSEISQNDKAVRQLTDVVFSARVGGAIHSVVIQGFITL